jgi:hypothetical protein
MDSGAIQRSLIILEERYHELREIGQARLQAWEVEKSAAAMLVEDLKQQLKAQAEANEQAHKALGRHATQLKVLDAELSILHGERDELASERDAAAMLVEDLKQQLEAQADAALERACELELEDLRQRLETKVADLEQQLSSRDNELLEAREAAKISMLQLHQVQLEREQYFMADGEKQRQLETLSRDLEELRRSKAAQENAHEVELEALRQRLEPRLAELENCLATRDKELEDAREADQVSILQLHQVRKELKHFVMADGEKQRQLETWSRDLEELRRCKAAQESAHELELEALRERLEPQLAELEICLATRSKELQEAREAAEISLLQLHQVQVELEHYLMADRDKLRQLEALDRELVEVRQTKAAQESALVQELAALRDRLEPRLAELEHCLASRDKELSEARQTAELTTLQLHQVQVELEHYFSADRDKLRQLEALDRELVEVRQTKAAQESAFVQELAALRERLEPRLAELEHCLASRDKELREAKEAADLSLLQLHQVQEELENYFLSSRASNQLAQAQFEQLQRARRLMLRLQPDVLPPSVPYPRSLEAQVLPDLAGAAPNPTLQTEALLHTYAASLQRASALLERAKRP